MPTAVAVIKDAIQDFEFDYEGNLEEECLEDDPYQEDYDTALASHIAFRLGQEELIEDGEDALDHEDDDEDLGESDDGWGEDMDIEHFGADEW